MKYKIEKNTVQETLILPLYSRKLCTELYQNLYRDETAVHLIDQIDYDFSQAEENSRSLMQRFGALEVAMRQNDLALEVQAYLKTHPCAAVVNLGCGLDNTGRACDNGRCKIYNLDFPDVIALRQQLLPAGEREQNGTGAGDGRCFSRRSAGVRRRQPHGGEDDRQNVAQDGENQGCGSIFRGFGCPQGDWRVGQPSAGHKPRLYAGLQRFERSFCQQLFPLPRKGRGQRDENADREDRIWRQAMKILVYGAGVLGCNLARNLLRAGKDVTLLARGNWAAEIKQNGLRIKDKFSLRTSVSRIPMPKLPFIRK